MAETQYVQLFWFAFSQVDNLLIFGVLHARRRLPSNQAAGKLHSLLKTANMAQPTARLGVCVKVMVFKDLDL